MVLAPHRQSRILGEQIAGLRHRSITREYLPRHDQSLGTRAAFNQAASNQHLICPLFHAALERKQKKWPGPNSDPAKLQFKGNRSLVIRRATLRTPYSAY